jgi:hypothetical protein
MRLEELEDWAARRQRLLRLQVRRRLGVWTLRVGVAAPGPDSSLRLLGELRGWALPLEAGLHLDTLRVVSRPTAAAMLVPASPVPTGPLIWAATFAWALEVTPCLRAELLAIHDQERQHRSLVRYFRRLGFEPVRRIGGGAADLPLRLLWGGGGMLMRGECGRGLERSLALLGTGRSGAAVQDSSA